MELCGPLPKTMKQKMQNSIIAVRRYLSKRTPERPQMRLDDGLKKVGSELPKI